MSQKYIGDDKDWWKKRTQQGSAKQWKRCYEENHKPLTIGGGTFLGGNCGSPIVKDYDIYIGLDGYSYRAQIHAAYPWADDDSHTVCAPQFDFIFRIPDMSVPKDVKNFKKMISWIADCLGEGMKVHVGCIGGHGRTGLVLAALVAELDHLHGEEGNKVIQWVREHYCKKAVESSQQINFLVKHYGVAKATPTKTTGTTSTSGTGSKTNTKGTPRKLKKGSEKMRSSKIVVEPIASDMCLFNLTNATDVVVLDDTDTPASNHGVLQ